MIHTDAKPLLNKPQIIALWIKSFIDGAINNSSRLLLATLTLNCLHTKLSSPTLACKRPHIRVLAIRF